MLQAQKGSTAAYKDLEDLFAPWTIRGQNYAFPGKFVDSGNV